MRSSATPAVREKPCRFGRHVWLIEERDVRQTPLEALIAARPKTVGEFHGSDWFVRDVVVTYACRRCGTEKVSVTTA